MPAGTRVENVLIQNYFTNTYTSNVKVRVGNSAVHTGNQECPSGVNYNRGGLYECKANGSYLELDQVMGGPQ